MENKMLAEGTLPIIDAYKNGSLNRRSFLDRLIAIFGSMAAAHLFLESTGLAGTLVSQVESSQINVDSDTISYPSTNQINVGGYLSKPQGKDKFPGVIVIHENRGLNEHTRDVARRFAAQGFVALAPDLLSRKGGTGSMASPDAAREAISTVSNEEAIADLIAGLEFLNRQENVKRGHIGSVGFCWGGARSFLLATSTDLLRAAVVFYGSAPPMETLKNIQCPVLGLYGASDERITSHVPEVAEAMRKNDKQFEYKIYPGAGHAFFNDTGERYNADASKDAWVRVNEFLHKQLK
jgi:carboxymethylenebutenolidase